MVAALFESRGAKLITLQHRMGASKGATAETVKHLVELGLVEKYKGYGHPMRPEYVLTEAGLLIGEACFDVVSEGAVLGKWVGAVMVALFRGLSRFGELMAAIPGITDRALAQTLRSLSDAGQVARSVDDGYPPTSSYQLTKEGLKNAELLQEIAKVLVDKT